MATRFNPQAKNLIVISVKIRTTGDTISYLFPLNPSSLTINQASRVSATFTYGAKVFQNLGAGLKTLSIEGHTGYKLDPKKYGIQAPVAKSTLSAAVAPADSAPGKSLWLDLYSIIQLIKGENKYLGTSWAATIKDSFSVDNIDNIETVSITIPDQGITYDVLLQNDSFMRNREQPHLYKYKLDFIITQESSRVSAGKTYTIFGTSFSVAEITSTIASYANWLPNMVNMALEQPGVKDVYNAYEFAVEAINTTVAVGNAFIGSANSVVNDIRRLERMTDALNGVTTSIGLTRGFVNNFKALVSTDLQTAFYEPYVRVKNIQAQMNLLKDAMTGEQQNLAFNVNMTRLASISAPVTLAANKATVAQFQKDIRQLNRVSFPFPIDRVEEITTNGKTKINVFFKTRPSSLGIALVKIYAINDFGNENDLVESFSDSKIVLSTNYNTSGYSYNFVIEYNYSSFESIVQPRYKSIKRVLIQKGENLDSIVKKYAPNEANASRTYLSEVAYLNKVEYPYVVTSDNLNFIAYFGSYGYKIFTAASEFTLYIYNIDTGAYPGQPLPLYDSTAAFLDDPTVFLLQQKEVKDQIKTGDKFFVLLFKETYSNRCYALFGITDTLAPTCTLFSPEVKSYVICALRKGRSYDINNDTLFEILSPYTITGDLVDYYDQREYFDFIVDPLIPLFHTTISVMYQIYLQNVGSFILPEPSDTVDPEDSFFPFTEDDKTFLAGDEENKNYVIFTNFTGTGSATKSSYSIACFSEYKVLVDGQEILLPSLEDKFLPFTEAFTHEDTYKVDLDIRFTYLDDTHVSILPRVDLGPGPTGEEQGILEFKLISGLANVKQAIRDRLECPPGGLILHMDYGLPVLLGKKNTLEHLILLRYNLYNQLMSDARVRSANDIQIEDAFDAIKAQASVILVNNEDVLIKTTL
jgi:hypothetical protein